LPHPVARDDQGAGHGLVLDHSSPVKVRAGRDLVPKSCVGAASQVEAVTAFFPFIEKSSVGQDTPIEVGLHGAAAQGWGLSTSTGSLVSSFSRSPSTSSSPSRTKPPLWRRASYILYVQQRIRYSPSSVKSCEARLSRAGALGWVRW